MALRKYGHDGVRKASRFPRRARRWLFWAATMSDIVAPWIIIWLAAHGK